MDITSCNRDKHNLITLGQEPTLFPLNEGDEGWHFYKQERCRREQWNASWFQSSSSVETSWLRLCATQRCPWPCLKLGHAGSMICPLVYFYSPKEIFEIKTHQKLSSFLSISMKDLSKHSSLFTWHILPDFQTENLLGLSRPRKADELTSQLKHCPFSPPLLERRDREEQPRDPNNVRTLQDPCSTAWISKRRQKRLSSVRILDPRSGEFWSMTISAFPSHDRTADSWKQDTQMNLLIKWKKRINAFMVLGSKTNWISLTCNFPSSISYPGPETFRLPWRRNPNAPPALPGASYSKHQLLISPLTMSGNITKQNLFLLESPYTCHTISSM